MQRSSALFCLAVFPLQIANQALELKFTVSSNDPRNRFDEIAYVGRGIAITGIRNARLEYIRKSADYGAAWRQIGNINGGRTLSA